MKLVCLNIWGGILQKELFSFIENQSRDTDIFCFQEVFENAQDSMSAQSLGDIDTSCFSTISEILSGFTGYYAPSQESDEGLAMFVKNGVEVLNASDRFVHKQLNAMSNDDRRTLGRNIQYLTITHKNEVYTLANFHGLWSGTGKGDTDERIVQSKNIREIMKTDFKGKIILVGDFNVDPETESMRILDAGMVNLIKVNNITSTRSSFHKWPNKFADYVIVSKDVSVHDFRVLQENVSDHLPIAVVFD